MTDVQNAQTMVNYFTEQQRPTTAAAAAHLRGRMVYIQLANHHEQFKTDVSCDDQVRIDGASTVTGIVIKV